MQLNVCLAEATVAVITESYNLKPASLPMSKHWMRCTNLSRFQTGEKQVVVIKLQRCLNRRKVFGGKGPSSLPK